MKKKQMKTILFCNIKYFKLKLFDAFHFLTDNLSF